MIFSPHEKQLDDFVIRGAIQSSNMIRFNGKAAVSLVYN